MCASLSEEDFQRIQNQLLELRTKNYSLEERSNKYYSELRQVHQNFEDLKHELGKAHRIIQRSKNARDLEQVLQENERLQSKLQSQEDEFRLQNETLMQEVVSLTAANEKLQKELEMYKSETCMSSEKEVNGSALQLKAENNALRKLLQKYGEEPSCNIGDGADETIEPVELDKKLKDELCLQADVEEKSLLKARIAELQKLLQEKTIQWQTENEKLNEKLKKKQDSIMQLHEEKEKLYLESQRVHKAIEEEKNTEILRLKEHLESLSSHTRSTGGAVDEGSGIEAVVELIDGEKATFERQTAECKLPFVKELETKLEDLNKQVEESNSLIRELENEKASLKEKNLTCEREKQALQEEKINLEAAIEEKSSLAEERKVLMDKMNAHLLEVNNKHTREIENLMQQLAQEQDALQKLFNKEKETRVQLIEAENELQSLRKELEQVKDEHFESRHQLREIENKKTALEQRLREQSEAHQNTIEEWEEKLRNCERDFKIQIEVARAEKCEFEEKVGTYQQEIKDLLDSSKIIEKKNSNLVKELKRQLLTERRRAEKLQERLQELLNEHNKSVDEILQSSTSEKPKGDASSVSSWSYVSADAAESRENPSQSDGSSCERDSPSRQSPNTLENETSNLLSKVAQLQQRNWVLEEKVNHLEMSNEALVDDLLKKTAIIQFYCMEGRSNAQPAGVQDKLTIKRIVDFIKDKGDENLREINRKMQRMLEETLTKNMHLQKDIETLSNEITRLSKLADNTE